MSIKRIFDFFASAVGLLLLIPFFLMIALAIFLEDGAPVFFKQRRVRINGNFFWMWKFRSMVVNAEKLGMQITVGHDRRITRLGHWLRANKLDELPQLWNVFVGDMSLVGPRPEVPHYVSMYTSQQQEILKLKPGITDPASIRFKNESELLANSNEPEKFYIEELMPQKIVMNLSYAKKANLLSDIQVILQTLRILPEQEL